jgi:hypothetical protein
VFSWFKPNRQREKIRKDRKHLEARARRLLKGYLSADAPRKQRYYEVIAGAAAACEPGVSDPNLENAQLAQAAAEAALKVVKLREHQAIADKATSHMAAQSAETTPRDDSRLKGSSFSEYGTDNVDGS